MKVDVWDTYVKRKLGDVLHFDIIVPDTIKDNSEIFKFGKEYLEAIGEGEGQLSTAECQFCHVEEPTEEMLASIGKKKYFILELEIIPAALRAGASRRDMIMHLKAHYPAFRFKNFRGITEEEVRGMLSSIDNEL